MNHIYHTSIDHKILSKLNCTVISPVPEGVERPFWTVMIPTYNPVNQNWLQQTIESVVEQDPGPENTQIELIDDCSTGFAPEVIIT